MKQTLKTFLVDGQLKQHRTSKKEISDLLALIQRDLTDARVTDVSNDWRYAMAYNAALQLATAVMYAEGLRTAGSAHHWLTFRVLPMIMGPGQKDNASYLNTCRVKRNTADYDRAGLISEAEVEELIAETGAFREEVISWLRERHSELLGND